MVYSFLSAGRRGLKSHCVVHLPACKSIKNYIIATFLGSMPSMFVTVSLGSGVEKTLDKADPNTQFFFQFPGLELLIDNARFCMYSFAISTLH